MPKCSVSNCEARQSDKKLFRFPLIQNKNEALRLLSQRRKEAWLEVLGMQNINPTACKNVRVCEDHFLSGTLISFETWR